MCQAKPGPRCSNDTAKEWQAAYRNFKAVEKEYQTATENYHQAVLYHNHHQTPESQQLLTSWEQRVDLLETTKEDLENKVLIAEYSFYSTPAGTEKLATMNKELDKKVVNVYDGFMLENGDWAKVKHSEYANIETTLLLQQAQTHRQRQLDAYNYVNHPNLPGFAPKTGQTPTLKAHERYIAVNNLISRVTAEKTAVENSLASTEKELPHVLEECWVQRNSPESQAALVATKRSIKLAQIKLVYLNLHLNDLLAFSAQHTPREIIAQ